MKLEEIYNNNVKPVISYEIFPPKNFDDIDKLKDELDKLCYFKPAFVSLTCSAGGSKNSNTIKTLDYICKNTNINIMPHLTCICNSKENINEKINKIKSYKIENILALRGDLIEDNKFCATDFQFANELVKYLSDSTNFSIGVAGYPEGHIDSPDIKTDLIHLKNKVNSGADAIFTQLFFDNNKFYKFTENIEKLGITKPIAAGIMPIISYKQVEKMTKLARITIPGDLRKNLEKYKDDSLSMKEFGIEYCITQCQDLIKNGVNGLHFFTLDKSYSTCEILKNI